MKHGIEALAKAILVGIVYFFSASIALLLSDGPFGFAPLWPSSGILLAALLVTERGPVTYLAAVAAASLAANLMAGGGWPPSVGFTVANVLEPLLACQLIKTNIRSRDSTGLSGRDLAMFCLIVAGAAAGGGAIASLFVPRPALFFASWFMTDWLGMLIVTPITVIVARALSGRFRAGDATAAGNGVEAAGLLAMVALVTVGVFAQSSYPLLFLPLAVMMLAVVRLGMLGASAGVLLIAIVCSIATPMGSGPATMIAGGRLVESFFLQFYLLALFAAALPTAALLGAERRLVAELREKNRMLLQAEAAAQLGHWRLTVGDQSLFWSDQTFRIYGRNPADPPTLDDALNAYVDEDRSRLLDTICRAMAEGQGYEIRARICRPDGAIRHVLSRSEVVLASDGQVETIFGTVQDVTAQSEQEQVLDQARIAAEQAAAAARLASETDPLTGLPNRRQLLLVLEQASRQAMDSGQPLSIAMLDLDYFKWVNDTFGHVAGDRVLQRVAKAAESALRASDVIGRFGGEEFVVVLPNATCSVAEVVAERVRAAIQQARTDPGDIATTASVGVTSWIPDEPLTALLQRADTALYEAKRAGRNVVRSVGELADVTDLA